MKEVVYFTIWLKTMTNLEKKAHFSESLMLDCSQMLLLSQTVLNYGPFYLYTFGFNQENFD